jgi:hypothetical protein
MSWLSLPPSTFGLALEWRDEVAVLSLPGGPTVGLLPRVGLLTGTLLPETKSDATRAADGVIA